MLPIEMRIEIMPFSTIQTENKTLKLISVKCPHCGKGVITRVPQGTDLRKLLFYTDEDEIAEALYVQVHKCPKCGKTSGVKIAG
jgi:predicted RNA-binding Zn-ribbon protein involved in translation (DUF1610 family)